MADGPSGPRLALARTRAVALAGARAAAVTATLGTTPSAVAQVNVEPLREHLDDNGVVTRLKSSVSAYEGNTEGVVLAGSGLSGLRRGRHLVYLAGSGDFTRFGGITQVFRGFGHLRYAYRLLARLEAEAFGQLQADRFRRWDLRSLLGLGPRVSVLRGEQLRLSLGTAYMLEDIRLAEEVRDRPVRPQTVHRWSNYAAGSLTLHERIELTHTTYVQPRFTRFADFRLFSTTAFRFTVTQLVSTGLSLDVRMERPPLPGVKATDLTISQDLALTF